MSIADDIINAKDLQREPIQVDEWGASFFIRELGADEVETLQSYAEKGQAVQFAAAVALSAVDQHGDQLFTLDDVPKLAAKNFRVLVRVAAKVIEINKLNPDAIEELTKNFGPTTSDDSGLS